jgi:hypothetical protein
MHTYGRGEVVGVKRYKKINKCCKKTGVFFPGDDGRGVSGGGGKRMLINANGG